MMNFKSPAGRLVFAAFSRGLTGIAGCAACFLVAAVPMAAGTVRLHAADGFPFNQELVLDAAPMRPAKRMPVLTVSSDGRAIVDLWCRTVPALVQTSGNEIRIETAPLPESLPQYMSAGQCTEQRMQADTDLLDALAQVTQWQRRADGVVFNGPNAPKPMRFTPSSH